MIHFKSVRWKNLLSTGNVWTQINFTETKNTLIVGDNGAGKSTLLDAICVGLFGKPFRKINKPKLINSINQKNMEIEIEFNIGKKKFKIVRGQSPAKFEIWENGVKREQEAALGDNQKYLEKNILKLNYNSFTQIVILGSNVFTPFMKLRANDRRQIIEDLLDISIFSAMNFLLKDRIKENSNFIKDLDTDIQIAKEKVKLHKQYILDISQNNKKRKEFIEEKLNQTQEEIKLNNDLLPGLESNLESIKKHREILKESFDNNNKKYNNLLNQYEQDKKHAVKIGKFFKDNDSCPTCEQNISESLKDDKITKAKNEYNEAVNQIKELDEQLMLLEEQHSQIEKLMDEQLELMNDISNINNTISSLNYSVQECTIELEQLIVTGNLEKEKKELQNIADDAKKKQKERDNYVEQESLLSVAQEMLKDNGVKTLIIKQYIPVINKLINKYLESMDFFVNFELDENFNECIKSRHRDDFSYDSFSEGEKSPRPCIVIYVATVAKIKNSVNTNLLILDEVFDSSLDKDGMDYLFNIFAEANKDGTNIFVISHRGDILQDKFDRTITFKKEKNFSLIEE